jgi:hypothetical protein
MTWRQKTVQRSVKTAAERARKGHE